MITKQAGTPTATKHSTDKRVKTALCLIPIIGLSAVAALIAPMFAMPGKSYTGVLPPLTAQQKDAADRLRKDLVFLTQAVGERNHTRKGTLEKSAIYIAQQFKTIATDPSKVEIQNYHWEGRSFQNIVLELRGDSKPEEIIVVGAHYDSVGYCPGADDNGTGTVGVIELARLFSKIPHHRTIRFVAFANEEYYFRTHGMGSYQYAERCHQRKEKIKAMLALEMLGYYRNGKGTQSYPPLIGQFYPDTGNFVAFVGDLQNKPLIEKLLNTFRARAQFPSEAISAPKEVAGIDWSDQLYFCQFGYPGLMITDTAFYRNPNYHQRSDTIETIDFDKMSRVVTGLLPCIEDLANN